MQSKITRFKQQFQFTREKCFKKTVLSLGTNLERVNHFCLEVDGLIGRIYSDMIDADGNDRDVCLLALGGYGRMELCPYSDIDVLILHNPDRSRNKIERMVRFLWDLGVHLGCVVRTIQDCGRILGQEIETDTAFLQARYLAGSHNLFLKLINSVVRPYFRRSKQKYITLLRETLFSRVLNPVNTIYHIEPDIKNGICGLRDCHRILWSEQLRTEAGTFDELHTLSHFTREDIDKFRYAYDFLIGLRIEMHFFHHRRIDVLESSYQEVIAFGLGFSDTGLFLEAFYKCMKYIKSFTAIFMEKSDKGEGLFNNLWRKIASVKINRSIYFLNGIFYPVKSVIRPETLKPLDILGIFQLTLRYNAYLSQDFCNLIRRVAEKIPTEDFISEQIYNGFRKILMHKKPGQTLIYLFETGILEKIIPEFKILICKVEYDTYHEYTVDQHTLLMVAGLDKLEECGDKNLYRIYHGIENKFLLRLCFLLHDIGKSMPGDHCKNGAIIASIIGNRLGLNNQEISQIKFIIYNHLLLTEFLLTHEWENEKIREIAEYIGSKTNLDFLYILTVMDIKNVGSKTWTEWKGVQLRELYSKIVRFLIDYSAKSGNGDGEQQELYSYSFFDSDKDNHQQWFASFRKTDDKQGLHLYSDEFTGFIRLTVIGLDRPDFFTDIVGCISSEGYNILSAQISTTEDGLVLDIFYLEPDTVTLLGVEDRVDNIRRKWKMIQAGHKESFKLIKERLENYPPVISDRIKNEKSFILFNNRKSEKYTVLEVKTKDRFGLLFKISQILSEREIMIISAKLSTRVDRVVDVFYITDKSGNKITNPDDLAALETELNTTLCASL